MDQVLCRPCGRITTELKDLMKDAELLRFYVFFAELEDLSFVQYIHLCADCEKKLYATLEFRKTCLSGESLRKTWPTALKQPVMVTPVQIIKASPTRPFIRKLTAEEVRQAGIIKPVQNVKKPSISIPTNIADRPKAEPTNSEKCVENQIETESENLKTQSKPENEEIIKSMRCIECPICKSNVYQRELECHMNLHVLAIETKPKLAKPDTSKFPYIELPPSECGKKRYRCLFEGCGAVLKNLVDVHMAKHFPELKKHMCSICGEKFLTILSLETHMNNHMDFMPYQCDQCPQRFRRKPHLKVHIRSKHLNLRYVCKDCGRHYSIASTYKYHVLLKHKGAKLICNVCKQSFNHRTAMDSHLRKEHQIPYDQSIHLVLPNNERLVRTARITEEMVFSSEKMDEDDYHRMGIEIEDEGNEKVEEEEENNEEDN